jgi:hypothetical protein
MFVKISEPDARSMNEAVAQRAYIQSVLTQPPRAIWVAPDESSLLLQTASLSSQPFDFITFLSARIVAEEIEIHVTTKL